MPLTRGAVNDIELGRGGSYSDARDVLKHQIYDEFYIGTTIADHTYFSQPIGSTWKGAFVKSIIETNLSDQGKLPNGQTFLVKRMGVSLISPLQNDTALGSTIAQAYYDLLQSSVFELRVAGREYDVQVHGRNFIPPVAVAGDEATNTAARYGDLIASGWYSLDNTPLFLDQLVNFSVLQRLSNPDTAVVTRLNADATLLNAQYCLIQLTLEGTLTRAK